MLFASSVPSDWDHLQTENDISHAQGCQACLAHHFEVGTVTNIHHNFPFSDMGIIYAHDVLLMPRPYFKWRYAIQLIPDLVLLDQFCIRTFDIPPSNHVIQ